MAPYWLGIKVRCSRCNGTGADDNGEVVVSCVPCGGSGFTGTDFVDGTELQADVDKCLRRLKKIMDFLGVND